MTTAPRLRPSLVRRAPGLTVERSPGTPGTRSWSASTRSAGVRGPARSPSAPRWCPGPAGLQDPRLQDAHRARARGAVRPHRRLVRGLGGGPCQPARSATSWACPRRSASPPAAPSTASASSPTRCCVDGNWDFVGGGRTRAHREGRRPLPVDRGGVDPGQGHPRPDHAGRGRALPAATTSSATRATRARGTRWRCRRAGPSRSTAGAGCSWTTCRGPGCPAIAAPTRS